MAKVAIKSDKMTSFGGIFAMVGKIDSMTEDVMDSTLRRRCTICAIR